MTTFTAKTQSKASADSKTAAGKKEKKNVPDQFQDTEKPLFSPLIQTKLTIGQPGDHYEREADHIADQVMRMSASANVQRKCAGCEEEEQLQRKPLAAGITPWIQRQPAGESQTSASLESRLNSSKGSGRALPHDTLSFMESRIGADFGNVKIHTDSNAVQMNRELGAQAFTHGNHVYFNAGKYSPGSSSGKHLLAHEMVHTVQQSNGMHIPGSNPTVNSNAPNTLALRRNNQPRLSIKHRREYTYNNVTGDLYVNDNSAIPLENTVSGGIDLNDVDQGNLGDCYFLTAVGAIARTNPKLLKDLIKDNGDGTFDVTLHVKDHFWSMERSPHIETVNLEIPVKSNGDPAYAKFGDAKELWVMILEKAYAQYRGGYNIVGLGGSPGKAMKVLTGVNDMRTYKTLRLSEDEIIDKIAGALDNNIPATASSRDIISQTKGTSTGIINNHAYVINDINKTARTISLYNAQGTKHLPALPISDFKKHFYRFQLLQLPPVTIPKGEIKVLKTYNVEVYSDPSFSTTNDHPIATLPQGTKVRIIDEFNLYLFIEVLDAGMKGIKGYIVNIGVI